MGRGNLVQLPIATGFYEDDSKPISAQECINLIPQSPQTNALTQAQLKFTPGLSLFATAGTIARRGEWVMDDIAYSVNGTTLYRINSDGTTTDLGTIVGSGQVSMVDNGTQLCIVVPASTGYIYTVSGGLVTITDVDYTVNPSLQVAFKDGYFIHVTESQFFISSLNDGTAYDALDFAAAEVLPDKITGVIVNRNQLYICGVETIEPFQNVGGVGFPFQRIPGAVTTKGIKAKFSLHNFASSFLFFGGGQNESPAIWMYGGASSSKISTSSIDTIISDMTDAEREAVYISTYSADGGTYANVHFNDRVLTYDANVGVWHERKSKDTEGLPTIWRVAGIMTAYGKTLVTDNQSGRIGEMSKDNYTEYGDSIKRVVASTPFHGEGNPVSFSEMELLCESGTANITGAGSDPHVSREYSDDGGYTFGNSTKRSLGKQGQYKLRQIWRREGQSTQTRVYRFTIDEPIKGAIFGLLANVEASR